LAQWLALWPEQARGGADALAFAAFIATRAADAAQDRGDAVAVAGFLAAGLQNYERLFAMFPDITTAGRRGDTRTFPGDHRLALLHYAALARRAGDEARAMELAGHLTRILTVQQAPGSSPLARAMLAAFVGERDVALDEFDHALVPGAWCVPVLQSLGVPGHHDAVFHDISAEPRFQRLVAAELSRRTELKAAIGKEAPDLLEPGQIFATR
jgi:hypothetical protein